MAITLGSSVTVDESDGLQNGGSGGPGGDSDDNDHPVNPATLAGLPSPFATALVGAGAFLDGALSGYNGSNTGVNAFSFAIPDATGMGFTDALGADLNNSVSGLFTTSGLEIRLYTDGSNNNIMYGMVNGGPGVGSVAFAAYLEETGSPLSGAKLWMMQYMAIDHPVTTDPDDSLSLLNNVYVSIDQAVKFSFANAPSGQNLFLMIGNADSGIVVTGKNPANQSAGVAVNMGDTVNTSQGGGSTTIGTNNQMVDAGEGMYLTYVNNPAPNYTIPNLDQGEADIEGNIDFSSLKMTNGGGFDISQLQKAKSATVKVTALETNGTSADFINNTVTNSKVDITSIEVRLGSTVIESLGTASDVNSAGISISIVDGVATIIGVKVGYTILYRTTDQHNRVLIENAPSGAAKASFDIGGVSLLDSNRTTDEIGSLMNFEDAGPSISQAAPVDTATVNTQDADTKGVLTDSASTSFAAAFSVGSSNYDADGAGSTTWTGYSLSVSADGADSLLRSNGNVVYLYKDPGTGKVVGSTANTFADVSAANTIFDLAVSAAGSVTLQQMAQIDHALPGVGTNFADQEAVLANGLVFLNATVTITDADGDSASDTEPLDLGGNVKFDDDGPGVFAPTAASLVNNGSGTDTESLNSDGTEGADIPGTVLFVDNVVADNYLRDSGGALLKSGGQNIVLSGYGTTTLTATRETGGETVFVATLNNTDDTYTITYSRTIDDGAGINFLGAAPVKSGNPTYNIIDNVGGTTIDLLFSGGDTAGGLPGDHSVNVSTTGAGTDNQSLNANAGLGEILRIDFETGASLAGSPSGSDFNAGTHNNINGFSFLLSQNTPSGTTGTAYIQAFDTDNDKVLVGDPDDDVDPITKVTVNGVTVFENGTSTNATINGFTVTAIMHNDGIVLTGLNEGATGDGTGGDDPVIKVFTATGFNRIEVANYAGQTVNGSTLGGTSFDIAPAGIDVGVAGDPFAFNLPVQNTDYDSDYSPVALIGVTMTPAPLP